MRAIVVPPAGAYMVDAVVVPLEDVAAADAASEVVADLAVGVACWEADAVSEEVCSAAYSVGATLAAWVRA